MKALILTMADKIQKIDPHIHNIGQPPHVPLTVPSDIQFGNPPVVAPDLPPSSLPTLFD